ncbi:MAG: NADP-specific glutamate dehydrogenase [Clostridia bacterium]|nr:NADP-specific glutamate dehydrogenase [Clostridia bacterium]
MSDYVERVLDIVKTKNSAQTEFIQACESVLHSIAPVVDSDPKYEKAGLLERLTEPERVVIFRIPWVDDAGKVQVNRGYRVQFSSAIGPFKGGLRFHPSVYIGIMKFLAFEQIFKNSLTGLPIGGAKGGADFDPHGKSDGEIMRFCQSFMLELYRHIGPSLDVPAGDIGVGGREIGYLYGMYKRITGQFNNGVLTGKGPEFGGSLIRPEATGYGAVYYAEEMLKHFGDTFEGKKVTLSGYGNVTWGVCKKLLGSGAIVQTISGRDGYVYDPNGIGTEEKVDYIYNMRVSGKGKLADYASKFGAEFHPGEKPWGVAADVVMPCATQNEVNLEDAKKIVDGGCQYFVECANMPATNAAQDYLLKAIRGVGPAKAANAGGVAVSGLEMSQNALRYSWTAEKVDNMLRDIMVNIYKNSEEAAEEYGFGYNLVAGADIAGFKKVANAMLAQGLI